MVGKRIQFDDETWEAIQAVMSDARQSFQQLANEAFADLLKKRKQPVGLKASLKESVGRKPRYQSDNRATALCRMRWDTALGQAVANGGCVG
jgi:hypothetical protein